MNNFVWDIETVPLGGDDLEAAIPPFDPNLIKTGNLGADKAREKIEKLRKEHLERFFRRAALSPLSGQIAAIGVTGPSEMDQTLIFGDEGEIIREWFGLFSSNLPGCAHWIGFNIANFDIPFICRRAWHLGIPVPAGITHGRYLSACFTDLFDVWRLTEYRPELISLSELARFLGLPAKEADGAQFGELLRYDPGKARAYLANDLRLTWRIAGLLGVMRAEPPAPVAAPDPDPGPPIEDFEPAETSLRFW